MNEMLNSRLADVSEILMRKFNQYAVALGTKHILTLGEPDFDTPEEIKASGIKAIEDGKTYYGTSYGNLDFREAIKAFEKRYNKIDYDVSEIIVTAGSTEGLTAALLTMLNPGDEVIIPAPTYPLYKNVIALAGAKTVPIDISKSNFQLLPDTLEKAITKKTKAIILTSPNNPTGTILNDESLEIVYQAVKKHKFFVISDEVYNQLIYTERKLGFSKYQDIRDYIIICQSLSKPYAMTGWRLGYLMAPLWFVKEVMKIHQYMVVATNTFIQDAGIAALSYDPTSMIKSYNVRREYVVNRLKEMKLEFPNPEGAFYVLISIEKFGLSSWEFCEKLVKEQSVALVPGICFDADDHIRVSYCVAMETLIAGMDGLEAFISTLEEVKNED